MVFSSLTFLTCALPVALAVYYLLPHSLRNHWLLVFSLVFYASRSTICAAWAWSASPPPGPARA